MYAFIGELHTHRQLRQAHQCPRPSRFGVYKYLHEFLYIKIVILFSQKYVYDIFQQKYEVSEQ